MGDTEYMAKKAFDNKTITVTTDIDADGSKLSYTVTTGKKFYFHSAKIVITGHTVPAVFPGVGPSNTTTQDAVEADLIINGSAVDTTNIGVMAQSSFRSSGTGAIGGYGNIGDGHFDVKGRTAESGQVIEIKNIVDDGTATATLIGFEEDTLTDPTLIAQSITVDASVAGDTGDLAFITEKVLAGDYFQESEDIDAFEDTIEFIVPDGKTAFLLEAKIVPNNTSSNNKIIAALKIGDVTKDEAEIFRQFTINAGATNQGGSGAGNADYAGNFNVKGLSLVGNGVDEATNKITIENIADTGGAFASMSGYLVDT